MKGVSIGGLNINNLCYADDTALCAENAADLQHVLDIVKVKREEFGICINVKKTKSMIFSRTENKSRIGLKLNGHIIEQVSNYIYLTERETKNQLGRECQELEWAKTARVHQNSRR